MNRLRTLRLSASLVVALAPPMALAGGGPQNVALLVNPSDPDSLAVANCYIELREIPDINVVYVPWVVDARGTSGVKFRDQLLNPALAELTRRGVLPQIDCIAFSSGFPYLIDCARMFPNEEFPRQARPMTSLTSAAYLYQFLLDERKEMFFGNVNLYYAPTENGKTASRAFSAEQGWGLGGVETSNGGIKYYLSTALGVTHGRGNSAGEIIECLRRAKAADDARYRGTIYYMQNKDVRSQVRHHGFQAAVDELAAVGVKGVILPGAAPSDKHDVAGLTTGTSHLHLRTSGCMLLPGALVDNLTSAGGQMLIRQEMNPQTRISEFIRLGAAGASGAVVEPFAIASKFPSPALHVHYARGCSLAESFYQSIAAPCHLLVIGDPLCQPWAAPPQVTLEGLTAGEMASGTIELTPAAKYPDARQASRFELYVDGVRAATAAPGEKLTWATKKLFDGWHDLRVAAIDDTPIAVQGFWTRQVQVKNGRDAVQLSAVGPLRAPLDGSFTLAVAGTVAEDAEVWSNGRMLATIAGGQGETVVPAKTLGRGKVDVYALQRGAARLRSRPITLEVY